MYEGFGLILYGLISMVVLLKAHNDGKDWRFFAIYSCFSIVVLGLDLMVSSLL